MWLTAMCECHISKDIHSMFYNIKPLHEISLPGVLLLLFVLLLLILHMVAQEDIQDSQAELRYITAACQAMAFIKSSSKSSVGVVVVQDLLLLLLQPQYQQQHKSCAAVIAARPQPTAVPTTTTTTATIEIPTTNHIQHSIKVLCSCSQSTRNI